MWKKYVFWLIVSRAFFLGVPLSAGVIEHSKYLGVAVSSFARKERWSVSLVFYEGLGLVVIPSQSALAGLKDEIEINTIRLFGG